MQFTEEKALELVEQHNLSKGTINTWRMRNSIPDKYETGVKTKVSSESELQQQTNLIRAVRTDKFNKAALCRLAELNSHHPLEDAVREKSSLTKEDLIALKKAVNTLRNEVKKVLIEVEKTRTLPEQTIKLIKKLFERSELQWFVILGRNKETYGKFESWVRGARSTFPADEIKVFQSSIVKFITETAI